MNKSAIIILNWNGYADTIECLESLLRNNHSLFDIIVVDNGSHDDSVQKIQEWFLDKSLILQQVGRDEVARNYGEEKEELDNYSHENSSQSHAIVISDLNLGFSAGNNLGVRYALQKPYAWVMLLNNDTTLEPETIQKVNDAMNLNPNWGACVPKIKYYDSPKFIWNTGGFLRPLGGRRYLNANAQDSEKISGFQRITFATGCALVIRSQVVRKFGGLCEDFFFGEEDYEFSKRMFLKNIEMFTVLDAVVYHKVGISRAQLLDQNTLAYDFTHHLNRLIHMKRYMSKFQWKLWRIGSLLYIFSLLAVKKRVPVSGKLVKYFVELVKLSNQHNGVDRELFLKSKEILK